MTFDIGCVIVTYNRLDKLKKTLQSYSEQLIKPLYIIVVNNASTDGTGEFLDQWKQIDEGFEKDVINSKSNLGGSGGFYLGEKKALEKNADWVMIADDDAYPESNYLSGLLNYLSDHKEERISIICGKVVEKGNSHNIHRTIWRSKWDRNFHQSVPAEFYDKEKFYPDFVSYVGIIINKKSLEKAGLVDKGNFIWCDDTEHTYRLSKTGKIVCVPKYSIIHDVAPANDSLSWKSYYGYRNDLIFFKKHFKTHYPYILLKLLFKTIASPLKGRSSAEVRLRLHAMKDSITGKMGIDELYKPGWKP